MAAFPFGDHPTLGDYLRWAISIGCTVESVFTKTLDGETVCVTRIAAPDGQHWVIEVGTEQHEHLLPTTIGRLDRRLGLTSPWFSVTPPDEDEDSA